MEQLNSTVDDDQAPVRIKRKGWSTSNVEVLDSTPSEVESTDF
jgi:hypothetical protein